ncbi:MAG: TIM barrel protein [Akkermansiaceae bacterium]
MELIFAKTKWEAWDEPLPRFLERAAAAGFTATEIFIPSLTEAPEEITRAHAAAGLRLVAQIVTAGATPSEHARSLEERYLRAIACKPLLVDCHTGDDAFSFEENLALFAQALELERSHGVPLCHELHRGRALYNAPDTLRYLQALPTLRINADFSHWQVVHESDDLKKHSAAVDAVIARADHIHARVGFGEGPQIPDPRAPEWAEQLAINTDWWRRIVATRRREGRPFLTISPEFGPVPYMPTIPGENRPVADAWEINCWMRQYLFHELAHHG